MGRISCIIAHDAPFWVCSDTPICVVDFNGDQNDHIQDDSRNVAGKFCPKTTPHVFRFDARGVLVYRGRIEDSAREKMVRKHELIDALDALAGGQSIPVATPPPFGCSIKWKRPASDSKEKS